MHRLSAVLCNWGPLRGMSIVFGICVWMTILSTSGLRNVWHNLHAAWNDASGATASGRVCGGGRAAKPFSELFNESRCHVISSDVNCICNT